MGRGEENVVNRLHSRRLQTETRDQDHRVYNNKVLTNRNALVPLHRLPLCQLVAAMCGPRNLLARPDNQANEAYL